MGRWPISPWRRASSTCSNFNFGHASRHDPSKRANHGSHRYRWCGRRLPSCTRCRRANLFLWTGNSDPKVEAFCGSAVSCLSITSRRRCARGASERRPSAREMDPRDLRQAFAANLRRLRHARGISQEGLAYEAGVNRTYLSKLEKGTSYPGLEIIAKLATVLEVEPAELIRLPVRQPPQGA